MGVTVLNSNWRELMEGLSDATRLRVYDAMFAYAKNRTIIDLPPSARPVFEETSNVYIGEFLYIKRIYKPFFNIK